jgi:hypothetical protein
MAENHPFPSINVSESEKRKVDYYEKWAKSIVKNTFNTTFITNYNKLRMLYDFAKVGTGSDLTNYLQTAPDGTALPGIWLSLNTAATRLDSMIGELEEKGYTIKCKALNSEALSRKLEEKERLRVMRKTQELRGFVQETAGIQLEEEEYVPQSEEELSEHMELTWKDKHVAIIESALKWIAHRNHWDETRKALFLDLLIGNMLVVRNDIVDGVPESPRIDLMKFIYDPDATDDMLSDATYFGEVDYVPLASAAERYGLSVKELEEAQKEYKDYLGLGQADRALDSTENCFGYMPGQSVKWFKTDDGTPRCLVIKACWRDYKVLSHKKEKNDKGEFFQDITTDEKELNRKRNKKEGIDIVQNKLECWRQATIIGGKFVKEWGECPNQPRELGSLQKSQPPYTVLKFTKSISLLERLVSPQVLKDILNYQLQIQIARSIGKVLVFDEAAIPQGMTKDSVLAKIKADGIAWINSKEYQMGGTTNLFQEVDIGLSQSISQMIGLIDYYDRQMSEISGRGAESLGQVPGSSTAVGVQQAALGQQSLITAPYFNAFERTCSRVHTYQAKLVKIAWADKEVFAPIIGDLGIDFLRDNIDISLDEFDAVCQSLPPLTADRAKLEQMLLAALQSDPEFIDDALEIMMESDLTVAFRKFKRKRALRRLAKQQQEQQMYQQEQLMQQAQMQQMQMQQQGNWQNQLQLQDKKNQANIQKTLLTGRTKLQTQKIDLLRGI